MGSIFQLQVRQILGGRKRWLVAVILVLPIALAFINLHFGDLDRVAKEVGEESWKSLCGMLLFILYPQTICVLFALLYGAPMLQDELEGRTLPYLLTRPMPRWKIVLGKYLAIVTLLVPGVLASLTAAWMILGSPAGSSLLFALSAATVAAVLAYNAIFAVFGFLIPSRAMIVTLMYAVVFEFILGLVPAVINTLTVTYYLRSLALRLTDLEVPEEVMRIVGDATLSTSLSVLGGMTLGGLVLASWLAAHREYIVTEQV